MSVTPAYIVPCRTPGRGEALELLYLASDFLTLISDRLAAEYRSLIGLEQLEDGDYREFDRTLQDLLENGEAASMQELLALLRGIRPRHADGDAAGLGTAETAADEVQLEYSLDAGGSWHPLYSGSPVSIRLATTDEGGQRSWRILYAERELVSMDECRNAGEEGMRGSQGNNVGS